MTFADWWRSLPEAERQSLISGQWSLAQAAWEAAAAAVRAEELEPLKAAAAADARRVSQLEALVARWELHGRYITAWRAEGEVLFRSRFLGVAFRIGQWWERRPWSDFRRLPPDVARVAFADTATKLD